MKFKLHDKVYDLGTLDRLSLLDILMMEKETRELGNPLKWSDVLRIVAEVEALQPPAGASAAEVEKAKAKVGEHPDILWMSAITIWSSRRIAGEKVSFVEAIDFPQSDMSWIAEPQDKKEAKKRPTNPARTRQGSGRAVKRPARAVTGSPKTSPAASTPG
jgi:hypothetical protein